MHRIGRRDLENLIFTTITCSRIKRRTGGRQIHASLDTQEGAAKLAQLICNQIDNDSSMVVVTEMVGEAHQAQRGKWDVDEPAPARVPVPPPPPPR